MALPDGLIVIAKRECPTCTLVEPLLARLGDGGVSAETIGRASAAGADTFVAGTAVFGEKDYARAIRALREAAGLGRHDAAARARATR